MRRSNATSLAVAGLLLAGALAVAPVWGASRRGGPPAAASPLAKRFPHAVITRPPPSGAHAVPGGAVSVSPAAILAGAPDSSIAVTLTLDRRVSSASFGVGLPARWLKPKGRTPYLRSVRLSGGGAVRLRSSGRQRVAELRDAPAGSKVTLRLEGLDPPAGSYVLDLLWATGARRPAVAQRATVVVYGRTRLGTVRAFGGPARRAGTRAPESYNATSDPAIAADQNGNFWYAFIAFNVNSSGDSVGNSRIVVNRLAAGTSSFQPANTGLPRRPQADDANSFQDKEMIAVDTAFGSPHFGRIYVVWNENDPSGGQNTVISFCDTASAGSPNCDNPDNWSAPAQVTDGVSGSYINADVGTAPNGDVYVVWWDYADNRIEGDKCSAASNCALSSSWGADQTVDDLNGSGGAIPFFCPTVYAPGGRVSPVTSVDVSQASGNSGRVFVTTSDIVDIGPPHVTKCAGAETDDPWDSFIASGSNGLPAANTGTSLSGGDTTRDHFLPWMAVDQSSGAVETAFYRSTASPDRSKARYDRRPVNTSGSPTGSVTDVSTADSEYSGLTSTGFDYGDYNGVAAALGSVYPIWTDGRDLSSCCEVYFARFAPDIPEKNLTADSGSESTTVGAETSIATWGGGGSTRILGGANNFAGPNMLAFLSSDNGGSFTILEPPLTTNAPTTPAAGGGGGGAGGAGPAPVKDTTPPLVSVGGRSRQRVIRQRGVKVTARDSETGTVSGTGTVRVRTTSRVIRFRRVTRAVVANQRVTLKLGLSRRSLAAIKRALRQHQRLRARIRVTGKDAAGNARTVGKTIRLVL